jgi:hypothetical protein
MNNKKERERKKEHISLEGSEEKLMSPSQPFIINKSFDFLSFWWAVPRG